MTSSLTKVYWDTLKHDDWTSHMGVTEAGLCCITLPNETFTMMKEWIERHIPGGTLIHDSSVVEPYKDQLSEYLAGERREFTCKLDLRGTPFQISVWNALHEIPFGTVRSYSAVATAIGFPSAVRAVGAANGANPVPVVIPCHRVIGKNGTLTGYRGGLDVKVRLLKLEGLQF